MLIESTVKIGFLFCALCLGRCVAGAQSLHLKTMDEIKSWRFDMQRGVLDATLSSYKTIGKPSQTVLSFELEGANAAAGPSEEAELLGKVLSEMPSLGYSPRKLQMISSGLIRSELQEGLSLAVSKSEKWRSCIGRKFCGAAYPVADQFLKSVDAYKEFDPVLHRYGLARESVTVDDMGCGTISGRSPSHTANAPSEVSCMGLLHIWLRPDLQPTVNSR